MDSGSQGAEGRRESKARVGSALLDKTGQRQQKHCEKRGLLSGSPLIRTERQQDYYACSYVYCGTQKLVVLLKSTVKKCLLKHVVYKYVSVNISMCMYTTVQKVGVGQIFF